MKEIKNNTIENKPRPFVKWAGGKKQIIDDLLFYMPKTYKTYFEPFVGGGALLFALQPQNAVINDFNAELINAYRVIKSEGKFKKLRKFCKEHEALHSEEHYYEVRALDRDVDAFKKLDSAKKASRLIYLNKSCFNGLYRVNRDGFFNVPSGRKETVKCFDDDNMNLVHEYLKNNNVHIRNRDFEAAVIDAKEGDFVYFDPPYDVVGSQSFTTYTSDGFDRDEQIRLRDVCKRLNNRGVKFMVSNANTEFINEIYKDFNIHVIEARRAINSKGDGRGKVEEVIITNY